MSQFEDRAKEALSKPQNVGEMADADSVGTVGSPDCGDMLRMWLKFTEKDGKKEQNGSGAGTRMRKYKSHQAQTWAHTMEAKGSQVWKVKRHDGKGINA